MDRRACTQVRFRAYNSCLLETPPRKPNPVFSCPERDWLLRRIFRELVWLDKNPSLNFGGLFKVGGTTRAISTLGSLLFYLLQMDVVQKLGLVQHLRGMALVLLARCPEQRGVGQNT